MSTFKGLVVGHLGDVTLRRIRQNHFCREKGISITYFSVCVRARSGECMCVHACGHVGVVSGAQACAFARVVLLI